MPVDYAELVNTVVDITKRPNLIPQIQREIAKATLKAHLADYWPRDILENKIIPDTQALAPRYQFVLSTTFPRFRALRYLYGYDDSVVPPAILSEINTEVDPSSIVDMYKNRFTHVAYISGDVLTINTVGNPPAFLVGYYAFPKVLDSDYTSWIAEMYHPIITDQACVEIFASIGDIDESNRRRKMFEENLKLLRVNALSLFGN